MYGNVVPTFEFESGRWDLKPYMRIRWKSADFNNRYYGLDIESPGSGVDFKFGTDISYHVWSNLYLIGAAGLTVLDSDTKDTQIVTQSTLTEAYFGFGFFNDKKKPVNKLKSRPYVRLAHGWATPSSMLQVLTFDVKSDEYNNQLSSLFVGIPVSDTLFTLPISVYFTPGIVFHHASEVQDQSAEYVAAIKFYYTFKWPFIWRLGFAEGMSYATDPPYIERVEMEANGYRPSELMNYLDVSLDFSLGELFRVDSMKNLWLGWTLHHRSGIFQTSSSFGRIKGGSNYNCVYLQYHW